MSLAAKIFIWLNQLLILGLVVLMAILLAVKADYKQRARDTERKLRAKEKEINDRRADYDLQIAHRAEKIETTSREHNRLFEQAQTVKRQIKDAEHNKRDLEHDIIELERKGNVKDEVNRSAKTRKATLEAERQRVSDQKEEIERHLSDWEGRLTAEESNVRKREGELR